MEFEGRISKVMPTRTGQRQDGSEWKALPFVFEYFENETDRLPDSVLLETTDHDTMRNIGQFVARGEDKKAIVKDGQCVLTGEIKCRCGFLHRVNTFRRKDGSGEGMMNNLRPYKLEIIPTATVSSTTTMQQSSMQQPPSTPQTEDNDDLPF